MFSNKMEKYKVSHPEGSVLALTLVIMLLMSLAVAAIFMNTKNELTISSSAAIGRNAFASADAAAQIASVMGRILLHPELGSPKKILAADGNGQIFPMTVEVVDSKFDLASLKNESADYDYTKRYIQAGSWKGRTESSKDLSPYIIFTIPGVDSDGNKTTITVATASFSMETLQPNDGGVGGSVGMGDMYDPNGGGVRLQVVMTVTANGRPFIGTVANTSPSATSFDGGAAEGPYSIITTIFKEIM